MRASPRCNSFASSRSSQAGSFSFQFIPFQIVPNQSHFSSNDPTEDQSINQSALPNQSSRLISNYPPTIPPPPVPITHGGLIEYSKCQENKGKIASVEGTVAIFTWAQRQPSEHDDGADECVHGRACPLEESAVSPCSACHRGNNLCAFVFWGRTVQCLGLTSPHRRLNLNTTTAAAAENSTRAR